MCRYYWALLLLLGVYLVPFVFAGVPTCQQLGLKDAPANEFTIVSPVIKHCWITYSGDTFSQMGGDGTSAFIASQMTRWSASLVEILLGANNDLVIQINPLKGRWASDGNLGSLAGRLMDRITRGGTAMPMPQPSELIPLGFTYTHVPEVRQDGLSTTMTTEAQIDMRGTNYTIDDVAFNIQWCGQTNTLRKMGQSWGGHGSSRKYRVSGSQVYAAGNCQATYAFAVDNYRIPIIRVIGGDGSGTVIARSEVQFGDNVNQNWWYVTSHKLIYVKQKWIDSTLSVEYRIDPSIKGPPDAQPGTSGLFTGAYSLAMSSGIVPPGGWDSPVWDCARSDPGTMWNLLCTSGFSVTFWDNVDRDGTAIRVPTFMIPVGTTVNTNPGQDSPASINLRGTGFKFKINHGFIASHAASSPAPIWINSERQIIKLQARRIDSDWAWIATTPSIHTARDGLSPILLDFADKGNPACSTWGMEEYFWNLEPPETSTYTPHSELDNPKGFTFVKACKLPLPNRASGEIKRQSETMSWEYTAVTVVVCAETSPPFTFGPKFKFMINPIQYWGSSPTPTGPQNRYIDGATKRYWIPVGFADSSGNVQAKATIDLRGTQFYLTKAPMFCRSKDAPTAPGASRVFAEDGFKKTFAVTGNSGYLSWTGSCGSNGNDNGLQNFNGEYRLDIELARRVADQHVVSQFNWGAAIATTVHHAIFLDHYYTAGFQPGSYAINPYIVDQFDDNYSGSFWLGNSGTSARSTPVPVGAAFGSGSGIGWCKIILDWTEFKFDNTATGLTWKGCGGSVSWTTQQPRYIEYTISGSDAFVFPSSGLTFEEQWCGDFAQINNGQGYRIPLVLN